MIRKGKDGQSWIVIPGEGTSCGDCAANKKYKVVGGCLDAGNQSEENALLCEISPTEVGRVLADSPEARAELFAAKALRS